MDMPKQLSGDSQPVTQFYRRNEHLGPETRETEFKSGHGFIQYNFRQNVAKYVCGFINSQENGKLMIGVNDEGFVCGYDCSHQQEDILRRDIDEAVKDIVPTIFPKDYSVRFVPVCNEHGHPIGNSKVIEIMVQGANMKVMDKLYCNNQGIFMRRDGSIQALRPNEAQEWLRRGFQDEADKQRKNQENLQNELQNKQSELRQMEEKLSQNQRELDRQELHLQRQQSAVGHVADENRQLKDVINHLQQNNQQNEAQGGAEVIERLAKVEQLLVDQKPRKQNKQSKACVIS